MTKEGDELWTQQECQAGKDWSDEFMEGLVYGGVPQGLVYGDGLMGEDEASQKVLVFLNPPKCYGVATELGHHPGRGEAYVFYGCSHQAWWSMLRQYQV